MKQECVYSIFSNGRTPSPTIFSIDLDHKSHFIHMKVCFGVQIQPRELMPRND
jgi:hypothetical protein